MNSSYRKEPGPSGAAPRVLIVGGSLVGLSTAVFLAKRGVPVAVVERYPGSSEHPRAIGFTPRTMELYRAAGLGARIPQVPPGLRLRRARVESLAGRWIAEVPWSPADDRALDAALSPCRGAALAQDRLEPILREQAIALGADVRLETELIAFEQDASGVRASLRGPDGQISTLAAAYLVAADGNRSAIREALGVGRSGRGALRTIRSVIFRAPLDSYLARGVSQFNVEQPGFEVFLTTYGDGRWILFYPDEEHDEASQRAMIARALGRDDLPIELVVTGRFEISALIADRFSVGRVFLTGDAAHTLPPNRGGYGANTGIEDGHNLAWKLAAVLAGESTPALLDSYDAERRSIAWLRHQQIFARADFKAHAAPTAAGEEAPIFDDAAMELGQLYRSAAVLDAGPALPPAARPEQWAGQPGTRAPHLWVDESGTRQSTLDLFQRTPTGWVLLTQEAAWRPAAAAASARTGVPVACVVVGDDVTPEIGTSFAAAYGLRQGGASLIRPDGYVAWRAPERPAAPADALAAALTTVAAVRP